MDVVHPNCKVKVVILGKTVLTADGYDDYFKIDRLFLGHGRPWSPPIKHSKIHAQRPLTSFWGLSWTFLGVTRVYP